MGKLLAIIQLCILCLLTSLSFAQQNTPRTQKDSLYLPYPFRDYRFTPFSFSKSPFSLQKPQNFQHEVIFDIDNRNYITQERIGNTLFRPPTIWEIDQFKNYEFKRLQKEYWNKRSNDSSNQNRVQEYFPLLKIQNPAFERIFGSNEISITPKGSIDISLLGRRDKNQNPMLDERYRNMFGVDFEQNFNFGFIGKLGDRAEITANFSSEAQFDFENQIRFDYRGREDDILQRVEIGHINFRLPTTFIQSEESLFGIKTQLQFGKLQFTGIAAQQRSTKREIILRNGNREQEINLSLSNYDENQHYFLAQYFKETYSESLKYAPTITSGINITQIEVWVNNSTNSLENTRDILALLDLGEHSPYNPSINQISPSKLPSTGIPNEPSPQLSNNLLSLLGEQGRENNNNFVNNFFASTGANDNYAKITAARKLIEGTDYNVNRKLGYISLFAPLQQDQILSVSFRYIQNGKEYQVGEISTDYPSDTNNPKALYTKLLKNSILKTNLPTWGLMMKNIYSINTSQISENDLNLQIYYTDQQTGAEYPILYEGQQTADKSWLQLLDMDKLTQNLANGADGKIDFLPDVTIDNKRGKLIFPIVEPLGEDLAKQFTETILREKYTFTELYNNTKNDAQQKYTNKDRYKLKGTVSSSAGTGNYQLGLFNLKPNSIRVESNGIILQEQLDFSIDYANGELQLINKGLLYANQTLKVTVDNEDVFGFQQKTLLGGRFDYNVNKNLILGATFMKLSEKPFTEKVTIGNEPISNTMIGADLNYSKNSRWLTRMLNKIPFLHLKEESNLHFYSELAYFKPNTSSAINGTSYIDDFENSFSFIDLKNQLGWQISGTPQLFPESRLQNDLAYGYNRAHLAFYNIDPVFYQNSSLNPGIDQRFLFDHRTRKVTEKEVFPFKEIKTGDDAYLPTLDLAFYPMLRGTYNFSTNRISTEGQLLQPEKRWAGIFKKIETTDFETQNIEFLEMWIMDPNLTNPNKSGGDIYFNLGSISEDILKDGRKSLENALPINQQQQNIEQTVWGNVVKNQPISQNFENSETAREKQDIGLDGLDNKQEQTFFQPFLQQVKSILTANSYSALEKDPAGDDYIFFRSQHFDSQASILDRYKYYNGTQGNSKTKEQSIRDFGIETSSNTLYPDGEDIDRDNNMNDNEEYYQYKISIRPQDMIIGQNFVVDEQTSRIRVLNKNIDVKWYKIRIPLSEFESKQGNIQDFKSIRYIRMFMTNFNDTSVVRMARLQFVKGQWRKYNTATSSSKVISEYEMGIVPDDKSLFKLSNINIEENGKREQIPYVIPPGINRQVDYANNNLDVQLNEQSLQLHINNLKDGYGRAAFKTANHDFRPYGNIEMFIHAEGENLENESVRAFFRLGADDKNHYYEYDIPLSITPYGSVSASSIWPEQNKMNIEIRLLLEAKLARDKANYNGHAWPIELPFTYMYQQHRITVLGSPDLSKIKFYMIGVRNPLKGSASANAQDNGLEIKGDFWFNELRLSGFDSKAGWAATAQLNLKLAELANIAVTGTKMTHGFGNLQQNFHDRNRMNKTSIEINATAELGHFFAPQYRIMIPFYFNYSNQILTPEYNPLQPDIELSSTLSALSRQKQDSLLHSVQDYSMRKGFSLMNVRKMMSPDQKIKPWHIENFSISYNYSELNHRDFNIKSNSRKNYRGMLDYTFNNTELNFKKPFSNNTSFAAPLLRNINYNLLPSLLNFRMEVNRLYSENTFRDNANDNILPTYYNKNFNINRLYGISWDITQSLRVDFNATNYSIIDEPFGRMDGARIDTLWNNFWKMGRTTDYNHMMNLTYTLPLNKFKVLNWINVQARYGTQFHWQGEPLNTLQNTNIDLGNSIQNNRIIQINPTLNFNTFYNKFRFIRENIKNDDKSLLSTAVRLFTSLRNLNAAYTKVQGTYLPGYLLQTNIFGYNFNANAPGIGFLLGSQNDILSKAKANNWISTDTSQTNLYTKTYTENISALANLEPFRGFRIDLTWTKIDSYNSSFSILGTQKNPYTNGNYTISQSAIKNSFKNDESLFAKFEEVKQIISQELGLKNINSAGLNSQFFADGYDQNQQDVIVNAFLKTYLGKDIDQSKTANKPSFPLPNWRISYNRLANLLSLEDVINNIFLNHSYQSQYIINGYNSNALFAQENGDVYSRDINNNFLSQLQYQQISVIDRFVPLIGLDIRFYNNLTLNSEYRKSRDINLSLTNSQISLLKEESFIIGLGFRKTKALLPFGLFADKKWNNDLNFKIDIAVNDRKASVYRSGMSYPEVSAGNKSITLNPTLDYTINRLYNIRLFYNSNVVRPYTSQSFVTSYSYFGINLRVQFQ